MDALPLRESDPPSETTAGARVRPRGTVSGGVPLLRGTPDMLSVPKSSAGIGHGVIINNLVTSQRTFVLPSLSRDINQKMDDAIDSLAIWAAECSKAQVPLEI